MDLKFLEFEQPIAELGGGESVACQHQLLYLVADFQQAVEVEVVVPVAVDVLVHRDGVAHAPATEVVGGDTAVESEVWTCREGRGPLTADGWAQAAAAIMKTARG